MKALKIVRLCDVIASAWQGTSLDKVVKEGLSEEVTVMRLD